MFTVCSESQCSEGQWHAPQYWRDQLTPTMWAWLTDDQSLTERLERHARQVEVKVLNERWTQDPSSGDSAQRLCREVLLYGDGQAWVYACSLIPARALDHTPLDNLGSQPLGKVLFAMPDAQRGPIAVGRFEPGSPYGKLATQLEQPCPGPLWGRRSQVYLADDPLQITEIFLPAAPPYR